MTGFTLLKSALSVASVLIGLYVHDAHAYDDTRNDNVCFLSTYLNMLLTSFSGCCVSSDATCSIRQRYIHEMNLQVLGTKLLWSYSQVIIDRCNILSHVKFQIRMLLASSSP
jgi:hypothetical protein